MLVPSAFALTAVQDPTSIRPPDHCSDPIPEIRRTSDQTLDSAEIQKTLIPDQTSDLSEIQKPSVPQPSIGPDPSSDQISDQTTDSAEIQTTVIIPEQDPDQCAVAAGGTGGVLTCSECEFQTGSRAQLKMHLIKHRPRKWQCAHCGLNFTLL